MLCVVVFLNALFFVFLARMGISLMVYLLDMFWLLVCVDYIILNYFKIIIFYYNSVTRILTETDLF
jgi:hypothetical protein